VSTNGSVSLAVAGWPYVAFGHIDGTVEIVGIGKLRTRTQSNEHSAKITAAAFSADGRWLLTGDENGAVRMWDAVGGILQGRWREHNAAVKHLEFGRDARLWVSHAADGTAQIHYRRLQDLLDVALVRHPLRIGFAAQVADR
jgi:WD40 repeat protein